MQLGSGGSTSRVVGQVPTLLPEISTAFPRICPPHRALPAPGSMPRFCLHATVAHGGSRAAKVVPAATATVDTQNIEERELHVEASESYLAVSAPSR